MTTRLLTPVDGYLDAVGLSEDDGGAPGMVVTIEQDEARVLLRLITLAEDAQRVSGHVRRIVVDERVLKTRPVILGSLLCFQRDDVVGLDPVAPEVYLAPWDLESDVDFDAYTADLVDVDGEGVIVTCRGYGDAGDMSQSFDLDSARIPAETLREIAEGEHQAPPAPPPLVTHPPDDVSDAVAATDYRRQWLRALEAGDARKATACWLAYTDAAASAGIDPHSGSPKTHRGDE
jgi:hypothetical protein